MSKDSEKSNRGRPTIYPKEIGPGVQDTIRFPQPMLDLLKEDGVKLLLAWMALKPSIKERAIKLIPKKEREAKLKKTADPSPSVSNEPILPQDPPDSTHTSP